MILYHKQAASEKKVLVFIADSKIYLTKYVSKSYKK